MMAESGTGAEPAAASRACTSIGQEGLSALVHRGGRRAEIFTDGSISVGDPIELIEHDRQSKG